MRTGWGGMLANWEDDMEVYAGGLALIFLSQSKQNCTKV